MAAPKRQRRELDKKEVVKPVVVEKKWKLFDYIKAITSTKEILTDDDLRDYNPYIINRYLSCVPQYTKLICYVNKTEFISNKSAHYEFLRSIVPKRFVKIDYIDTKMDSNTLWELGKIMDLLKIGMRDAKLVHAYHSMEGDLEDILKPYREK